MHLHIRTFAAFAFALTGLLSVFAQQSPVPKDLPGVLPPDAKGDAFAVSPDASRTYYVNGAGEIWLYDVKTKATARIADGPAWDLSLARTRAAIVYARRGDGPNDRFVWISPLDPKTGLAAGAARRVSARQGDVPAISPDGSHVAFARDEASGVSQSLVVMAVAATTERVLVTSLPSIDHIRWDADGASLYFGVNPPPPCVPEWSCLPIERDASKQPGSIRRVPLAGGAATVVIAATRSGVPGLSPDGSLIVSVASAGNGDFRPARDLVVSDRAGQTLKTLTLGPTQAISGWLNGATLLVRSAGNNRRLLLTNPTGGSPRQLWDSPDPNTISTPVWSPSGKTMAVTRCVLGGSCELRLFNADGSLKVSHALTESDVFYFAWSPDERWISYTGSHPNQSPQLFAFELAPGRSVPVYDMSKATAGGVSWSADSTRLVVPEFANSPEGRKVTFRLVDLKGAATTLREMALGPAPSGAFAIDDKTVVITDGNNHDFRIGSLSTDQPARPLLPGIDTRMAFAAISPDRKWAMVRYTTDPSAGITDLDVCRTDGSGRVSLHLPFQIALTAGAVAMAPSGLSVLVSEAPVPGKDPAVYSITLATKVVTELFTYPVRPGRVDLAPASDGRTLAYVVSETMSPSVSALDLSMFAKPIR